VNPQEVAEKVRDGMFANDTVAQFFGMQFIDVAPGYVKMSMKIRPEMLNGFKICHGGMVTTLADTAFAYACNSANEQTVASGLSMDFIAPSFENEILVAEAKEVSQAGRTGVYDITVTKSTGELIAVMRGKSYRIKGKQVVDIAAN
jgi:acyl-CoA thioesterase